MKRLILIAIAAIVSVAAQGQKKEGIQSDTIPVVNGNYQFQEVVKVDNGLKKDQLYKNAKLYFMDIFIGAKDAFQYDDREEGRIIGKGALTVDDYKVSFPGGVAVLKWDINYNTEITCKDGKYRYRIYDIVVLKEYHVSENNSRSVHLTINDIYDAMPKQRGAYKALYPRVVNKMIAEFKTNINTLKESMDKRQPDFAAGF
jgi:hypothetical protein